MTRMRTALTFSYNLWAVKTVYDLGLSPISDVFQRFGLNYQVTDYSIALGTYEVIPIQLISAYTAFANEGIRVKPILIDRIEDRKGRVLEKANVVQYRVCTPEVAYIMTSMLQSVVNNGTGTAARQNYSWQAAGKTGTTDDFRDAWFIGFNRSLICGIWTGFDKSRNMGSNMSGGVVCAPVWGSVMRKAILSENKGRYPSVDDSKYIFREPEGIVHANINANTGFVTTSGGISEIFISGFEPTASADTLSYNFYPTRYRLRDPVPFEVRM